MKTKHKIFIAKGFIVNRLEFNWDLNIRGQGLGKHTGKGDYSYRITDWFIWRHFFLRQLNLIKMGTEFLVLRETQILFLLENKLRISYYKLIFHLTLSSSLAKNLICVLLFNRIFQKTIFFSIESND